MAEMKSLVANSPVDLSGYLNAAYFAFLFFCAMLWSAADISLLCYVIDPKLNTASYTAGASPTG